MLSFVEIDAGQTAVGREERCVSALVGVTPILFPSRFLGVLIGFFSGTKSRASHRNLRRGEPEIFPLDDREQDRAGLRTTDIELAG